MRKFAREQGVDIAQVQGSGNNGKVTRDDVEAFKNGGGQRSCARSASEAKALLQIRAVDTRAEEERVPFKGIRKAISNAMVKSAYTALTLRLWTKWT